MSNDNERELWVLNDETLFNVFKRWKRFHTGGMRGFIRAHRETLDKHINQVLGQSPK